MSSLVIPDADLQPVDWATANRAIINWLKNSIPTAADRVWWRNQNIPQPARDQFPFISVIRTSIVDEGGDPEIRTRTLDPDGNIIPPGGGGVCDINEEVSLEPVRVNVSVSAHVDFKAGANDPSCDAIALLSKAQRSLSLHSTLEALCAAGLSVIDDGSIIDTSVVVNGEWQSQANLDVVFRTMSVIAEKIGFIDKVQLVSPDFGVDCIVDAS